jgi:hypothetical protein
VLQLNFRVGLIDLLPTGTPTTFQEDLFELTLGQFRSRWELVSLNKKTGHRMEQRMGLHTCQQNTWPLDQSQTPVSKHQIPIATAIAPI